MRESVRGRGVRAATGSDGRKKQAPAVTPGHARRLPTREPLPVDVILRQGEPAAREERGSCGGSKSPPRWVWHAIAHHTGQS